MISYWNPSQLAQKYHIILYSHQSETAGSKGGMVQHLVYCYQVIAIATGVAILVICDYCISYSYEQSSHLLAILSP